MQYKSVLIVSILVVSILAIVFAVFPTQVSALPLGAVLNLPLNENSGITATDTSGRGNNATLLNGATWTTGHAGSAVQLDGTNDFLSIATSASLNVADAFTLSFWAKRARSSIAEYEILLSQGSGKSVAGFSGSSFAQNDRLFLCKYDVGCLALSTVAVTDTLWHHHAITKNGSATKLYMDGVDVTGTVTNFTMNSGNSSLLLGSDNPGPSAPFQGALDDVLVYNRALTHSEVQAVFTSGSVAPTPPVVFINSPPPGITLTGTEAILATATDNTTVTGVQFMLDGLPIGLQDTVAPYSLNLNTAYFRNGAHTITAVARDPEGTTGTSAGITVTFTNTQTMILGNIMPLGDSITYGYVSPGSLYNDDGGYRAFLWQSLVADGFAGSANFVGSLQNSRAGTDPDHEGHNGWRTDQIQASVSSWFSASQPNVVLFEIGPNDIIQGVTPTDTASRISNLLSYMFSLRPNMRMVFSTLHYQRVTNDYPAYTADKVAQVNSALPAIISTLAGQGYDIKLIDMNQAGLDTSASSADFGADGIHPTPAGYAKMAAMWRDALYSGTTPAPDTEAPSAPTGLGGIALSSSQINLSWSASTDNIGVTGYRVYRNNVQVGTSATLSFSDRGLSANTTYTYNLVALDGAGNQSPMSSLVSVTTARRGGKK